MANETIRYHSRCNEAATRCGVIRGIGHGCGERCVVDDVPPMPGGDFVPVFKSRMRRWCACAHAQNRGKGAASALVGGRDGDLSCAGCRSGVEPAEYPCCWRFFPIGGAGCLCHAIWAQSRSNSLSTGRTFLSWVAIVFTVRASPTKHGVQGCPDESAARTRLAEQGFEFCAEVTARLAPRRAHLRGADFYRPLRAEGKKIGGPMALGPSDAGQIRVSPRPAGKNRRARLIPTPLRFHSQAQITPSNATLQFRSFKAMRLMDSSARSLCGCRLWALLFTVGSEQARAYVKSGQAR